MDRCDLEDALHKACVDADISQVQLLIQQGAAVNKIIGPPGHLDYSINLAATTGCIPLVRLLLDAGANVNAAALRDAAFRGDWQMLQLLLEPIKTHLAKAGMSRKWRNDLATILAGTLKRGHSKTAEALKVFRSRVDDFDKTIDAGLVAASASGDMRSINYFLGLGASNRVESLSTAAEYNQFEPMQYFLQEFEFEPEELSGPLISAAASGHMPSVLMLLERDAYDEGGAALSKAAKFCHVKVIEHLLQHGTYLSEDLSQVLSVAARTGDTKIMDLLIEGGAQGSGALEATVQQGHMIATELLLQRLPFTPTEISKALDQAMFIWLHPRKRTSHRAYAVEARDSLQTSDGPHGQISKMLLKNGARLSDDYYCRLLEMMILLDNPFGLELLEGRADFTNLIALPDQYLTSLAIYHQRSDSIIENLLKIPISSSDDIEESNSSTKTVVGTTSHWEGNFYDPVPSPLISAVLVQNEKWCRMLLKHGSTEINDWCSYKASARPMSYFGLNMKTNTPKDEQFAELGFAFGKESFRDSVLSIAVRQDNMPIVRLLIENGADPWMNRQGISVFELSAKQKTLEKVLSILEECRADPSINRQEWSGGRSILHWAAAYGNADLIHALCKKGSTIEVRDGMSRVPLHVAVAAGNTETVKALLWAGAKTSSRDVGDCLSPDELAAKLARNASYSDPDRDTRIEISRYLGDWIHNRLDHLDTVMVRQEADMANEMVKEGTRGFMWEDDLVDHSSDEDSMHWSGSASGSGSEDEG